MSSILRAALNQRAKGDPIITNRDAWRDGLSSIADAEQSRNVILSDAAILRLVDQAYADSAEFGRLVELLLSRALDMTSSPGPKSKTFALIA